MVRGYETSTFVFLSSHSGRALGRVERRMVKVMVVLLARGATCLVICHPRSPMADAARDIGATVSPYVLDRFNYLRTESRVRKYFKRYVPVVAHSTGLEADLIVRWAARDLPVGVVNSIPCTDWPRGGVGPFSRWVLDRLDRDTIRHADAIVVDCDELVPQIAAVGIDPERIRVDPASVDIKRVIRQSVEPVAIARRGGPIVGYGGALEFSRGLTALVAAAPILDSMGTACDLVIAGDGPALRSLHSQPGALRVNFTGLVESVPAVLAQMAICVFPSTGVGMPTTLLEAAALGRPIVASNLEGIRDAFEDGQEIRLVEPGDPKALAEAIADLLADPAAAGAMAARARLRVLDEYSSASMIERHLAIYRRFRAR
ncbi:MAG: glycosyltransferase family 4 protein [Actinomycetota bacterium]|nr:glycosyltransferase family 4 protein [Actinomycetota bacterium]